MGKTQGGRQARAGRRREGEGAGRDDATLTAALYHFHHGLVLWRPSARDRIRVQKDEEKRARK